MNNLVLNTRFHLIATLRAAGSKNPNKQIKKIQREVKRLNRLNRRLA